MSYISRTANRFYAAQEAVYGNAATIAASNRVIAAELKVQQISPASQRKDKTGSRTYSPAPVGGLRTSAYQLRSYLTSLATDGSVPCAALFAAGCGAPPGINAGLIVASVNGTSLQTATAHGLSLGSGVSCGGEIRFVASVQSPVALQLTAPFTGTVATGASLGTTTTFRLGQHLNGVTLYDYWDPAGAVSRIVTGAVVDTMTLHVHGDQHEFSFAGRAADVLDSHSFTTGSAGLEAFPAEPPVEQTGYSVVPGQLGQVWLGTAPRRFFTLTDAQVTVHNTVALRQADLGGQIRAIAPGPRSVTVEFGLVAQDDDQTKSLYVIAKQRGTISVLLQMGQQSGRMMAVYLPVVKPELPTFDDSSERLAWRFSNNLAEGSNNDELYIAFA